MSSIVSTVREVGFQCTQVILRIPTVLKQLRDDPDALQKIFQVVVNVGLLLSGGVGSRFLTVCGSVNMHYVHSIWTVPRSLLAPYSSDTIDWDRLENISLDTRQEIIRRMDRNWFTEQQAHDLIVNEIEVDANPEFRVPLKTVFRDFFSVARRAACVAVDVLTLAFSLDQWQITQTGANVAQWVQRFPWSAWLKHCTFERLIYGAGVFIYLTDVVRSVRDLRREVSLKTCLSLAVAVMECVLNLLHVLRVTLGIFSPVSVLLLGVGAVTKLAGLARIYLEMHQKNEGFFPLRQEVV